MRGDGQRCVELELALFELLEQQIEGHDLGQRRRMAGSVGVGFMQNLARGLIDDNIGIGRPVTGAVDRAHRVATPSCRKHALAHPYQRRRSQQPPATPTTASRRDHEVRFMRMKTPSARCSIPLIKR